MKYIQILLFTFIISFITTAIGYNKGQEDLIKEIETKLYLQTKTHYLMCVPKPSKDILIYRKRT